MTNMPSWEAFDTLTLAKKRTLFQPGGRPYHALIAQQFERPFLDRLCELTTRTRKIAKTRGGRVFLQDLLRDRRAMLYFAQPSTRTFLSFYAACQILGMSTAEVRDTHTSSEIKGESPEDSVRTFSSYFDLIVMRHPVGGFAERIAWLLSNTDRAVPVVNAGSGKDQHPTQALLDIYTLQRSFESRGGIEGKHIVFVGDLARGRTVRSLSQLLSLYAGVSQTFVAPDPLQISPDVLSALDEAGVRHTETTDFDRAVSEADAVYMTRIQNEWDADPDHRKADVNAFHFTARHLELLKPEGVILHPLPRREEVALDVDADPRAVYWRQVRNGMWVRVALFLCIFEKDGEVDRYYADLTR